MKLPISMLVDYMNIDTKAIDPKEFAEKLTMLGQKVEVMHEVAKDITNVCVGKITKIDKHPDADKLVICQIDLGDETVQIVTGATNVFENAYVPVAKHNSMLANGLKIKKGKLRGVESNGMLCSVEELGFTRNDFPEAPTDGIYIFENELPLGTCIKDALLLNEVIAEFEITSNRPDCFSAIGLAREVAVAYNLDFNVKVPTYTTKDSLKTSDKIKVTIEDTNCKRYKACVVDNVSLKQSPLWLKRRLVSAGMRPINAFVDITNYILLEYGQPMHAFDLSLVTGNEVIVRESKEGEKLISLDGEERNIPCGTMVIADTEKVIAIAGIIGGENTKITDKTTSVLFECANFDGTNIRLSSKKVGLRTDSSTKFEKGLDENNIDMALNRALQLVEELELGEIASDFVDVYDELKQPYSFEFSHDSINKLIGTSLSVDEMNEYLEKFEIKVSANTATVPTFRPDITHTADLAEEVARAFGYNNIGSVLAIGTPTVGKLTNEQSLEKLTHKSLQAMGVSEIKNFSFESPKVFDKLNVNKDDKLRNVITINNPLGEDFSVMRTTLLNGMLSSISTNYNFRNKEVMFYEVGKVYLADSLPLTKLPFERDTLSLGGYGNCDFYDVKGIIEGLFADLGIFDEQYIRCSDLNFMHPTKSAYIVHNNKTVGFVGEIHPSVAKNYDIKTNCYVAELDLDYLFKTSDKTIVYKPLPKFPASSRDIALVVDKDLEVGTILKIIKSNAGSFLEDASLFDVFTSEKLGADKKSVAFSMTFRNKEATLTDQDVTSAMDNITTALEKELGITLRS